MFFTLLIVTLLVSALVSFIAARAFDTPVNSILNRLIDDTIASAWAKYMKFAIYVVGISGGVRIHALERYIMPQHYPKLEGRTEIVKVHCLDVARLFYPVTWHVRHRPRCRNASRIKKTKRITIIHKMLR